MSSGRQYLLAVYILGHRRSPPIPTTLVAETLDRTPASVTEAFKQLAAQGLVEYEPYDGVTLTESGREEAEQLHETYVTVSWFFRGVLELEDYEAEAMEMAGLVSPAVAERLAATLPCEPVDQVDESSQTD